MLKSNIIMNYNGGCLETFEGKVRKVGTSFGFLIPNEVVREEKLKKDEVVKVAIIKKDLSLLDKAFGCAKGTPFKRDRDDRDV